MATISQKHRNFIAEPMGNKSVTELAGIGPVLGARLSSKGYSRAHAVLGQFLILRRNRERFKDWLYQICNANEQQQKACYMCIKAWCDAFL